MQLIRKRPTESITDKIKYGSVLFTNKTEIFYQVAKEGTTENGEKTSRL